MKMSQKKQDALYRAIHDGIMDVRIALNRDGLSQKHDVMVAQAETAIWRKVKQALELPHE